MSEAEAQTHPDVVKHLKMIQNIIDRMARNSLWLRGWNAAPAALLIRQPGTGLYCPC